MNHSALQTFLAIIETGSLVKASERLNITQSSVTMRLKSLEDEVGQKLIVRQKSGATLTASGTKFLSYARIIDGLWGQALRATSLPQGLSQIYNLGCAFHLWELGGRDLFNHMRENKAGFALSVQQSDDSVLLDALAQGTIDMALVCEPVVRKSQIAIRLADNEVKLYSDRAQTPLRFDTKYIYVDYGAEFRRQHDAFYYDAGAAFIGFNNPQTALMHILEHGGSAYLPPELVAGHLETERLFDMKQAPSFALERHLILTADGYEKMPWLDNALQEIGLLGR